MGTQVYPRMVSEGAEVCYQWTDVQLGSSDMPHCSPWPGPVHIFVHSRAETHKHLLNGNDIKGPKSGAGNSQWTPKHTMHICLQKDFLHQLLGELLTASAVSTSRSASAAESCITQGHSPPFLACPHQSTD